MAFCPSKENLFIGLNTIKKETGRHRIMKIEQSITAENNPEMVGNKDRIIIVPNSRMTITTINAITLSLGVN
jgi:hypothetical protein